jgi:type IV pilus assembly protein PilE
MRARGFTLIELVIVTALVALLMTLAMPSYQSFVMRAHRVEAIAGLLQVAQCQERHRARTGAYDDHSCLPGSHARYSFAYLPGMGSQGWTVLAQPLAAQQSDACGTLSLAHTGAHSASGDEFRCWSGR